jgi:outer membrane protein TolC
MKKIIFLLILVLMAQSLYANTVERILTEFSSVRTALSINPDILASAQDFECAVQRVREAKSLYFPKINLNLNLSKSNNPEPIVISGESFNNLTYLPSGKKDLYFVIRPSIWLNIYTGGRLKTMNKRAQTEMNRVKKEEEVTKSKVVNSVKIIFNDCLYYKTLLELYSSKIESAKQGKIHLARNEVESLVRKKTRVKFNYDRKVLSLLNAIGLDTSTIVDISGELSPKIKDFNLDKCLLLAYQFKPEIKATQEQEVLDGLELSLESIKKYPNISVGAAYGMMSDNIIADKLIVNKNDWCLLFAVNIPIPMIDSDGLFAKIKQRKALLRKSTMKKAKLENEIKLGVGESLIEYNFWRTQAIDAKLFEKNGQYDETDIKIMRNLNKSYYNLELAVGVELDSY